MTTKRYALFVLIAGIATFASLILMVAMSGGEVAKPAEYPNREGFTQAIFWLEMVRSPEEVRSVLGEPGTETGTRLRRAMDATNRFDYIFLVCYPLLIIALLLFISRRLADTGRRLPRGRLVVTAGICLCVAVMLADAYENIQLLTLTAYTDLSKIDPAVITRLMIATRVKSGAVSAAGLVLMFLYSIYFNRSWGMFITLIYGISVALGIIALTVSNQRALIETAALLGMTGWLVSAAHAGYWYIKKGNAR